VVMARASQVTSEEIEADEPDDYPDIHAEMKPENCGRQGGRIVAVDYGLWDEASVMERRQYLAAKPPQAN
jgi:hypothetical protein